MRIQNEHSLYKVGFTVGSIQKRIANAENESTYLYAPVELVEEMKVVNLNAESLETALHHAMAEYQLDIDITAANGRLIHPREWFVVDWTTIEEIAENIISKLRMQDWDVVDGLTNFKHLDDTIALHQRKLDLLKEQKKGYLQNMFI